MSPERADTPDGDPRGAEGGPGGSPRGGGNTGEEDDSTTESAMTRWEHLSTSVVLMVTAAWLAHFTASWAGAAAGSVGNGQWAVATTMFSLCVVYAVGPETYRRFLEARGAGP